MSIDLQWTDTDPATGDRRFVCAEVFAKKWTFKTRFKRREDWKQDVPPTADMWADLLEGLVRRLPRREGVTLEMVADVRKRLAAAGGEVPD